MTKIEITKKNCLYLLKKAKSKDIFVPSFLRDKAAGWDIIYQFLEQKKLKESYNNCITPIENVINFLEYYLNNN